jgi:hypothetical protein
VADRCTLSIVDAAEFEARLAEGAALAPSLVGLSREEATERVTERGFQADAIPPTAEAVTADLRASRIRLFLDENDVVVRAHAG